jgi:hypothetical protein
MIAQIMKPTEFYHAMAAEIQIDYTDSSFTLQIIRLDLVITFELHAILRPHLVLFSF